jgi:ABC-type transport system substrate-binding protein
MIGTLAATTVLATGTIASPRLVRACASDSVLRIRRRGPFMTFDPADCWGEDAVIASNLLAPLMRFRPRSNPADLWMVVKHLAADLVRVDDRTYRFTLRIGDTWSGAGAISAADVKCSLERVAGLEVDPAQRIDCANGGFWGNLQAVDVDGALTGSIRLRVRDDSFMLDNLAAASGCIVSQAYVAACPGRKFTLDPGHTSGRYKLTELDPGLRAVLTCDPGWHGDPAVIGRAEFIVIADDDTAQLACRNGQIDVYDATESVLGNGGAALDKLGDAGRLLAAPTSSVTYLAMNTLAGPLARPELRKAIQLGLDRAAIGKIYYGDLDPVQATGLIPQGWPGRPAEALAESNPTEARRLIESIKADGTTLTFPVWDGVRARAAAMIGDQLKQLGLAIEVRPIPPDPAAVRQIFASGAADLALFNASVYPGGPLAPFLRFAKEQPATPHPNIYASEDYDALLAKATEGGVTEDLLAAMQHRLVDDGVLLPVVENAHFWWLRAGLQPAFAPDGGIGNLGDWTQE